MILPNGGGDYIVVKNNNSFLHDGKPVFHFAKKHVAK